MRTSLTLLRLIVRVLGTVMIILGLLFWSGNAFALVQLHMLLGIVLVLCLWTVAILAARGGEQPGLIALALLWGVVVPILGMTQDQLVPGDAHWVIRILHLLVGIGAIGLVEMLTGRALKVRPTSPFAARVAGGRTF